MKELRQIISEINVLEARLRQFAQMEIDQKKSYEAQRLIIHEQLEDLYQRKEVLMQNVDVTEPQYML